VVGNDATVERVWIGMWNAGMIANAKDLFDYK
jgi:hypothetical protein